MKSKKFEKLDKNQFELLSWFATSVKNTEKKEFQNPFYQSKLSGIESACSFANIPDEFLFDIRFNKNFTGLRNCNRLSETVYFE